MNLFHLILIVLFAELLVAEDVLFVALRRTHEAACRSNHIEAEEAVTAIAHVLRKDTVIGVLAVHTVVAEFAISEITAVEAVFTAIDPVIEVTVATIIGGEREIAIFVACALIAVVGVVTLYIVETEAGDDINEIFELIKEWCIEIELPSVTQSVPTSTPVTIATVHRRLKALIVYGDNLLFAESALSSVQSSLIAKRHTPLMSTGRTFCWFGFDANRSQELSVLWGILEGR